MQKGVTSLSCFYNPNRDLEKTFRNPTSDPTWVTFVCKIAW